MMMSQQSSTASTRVAASLTQTIAQLARDASIEINVQDVRHLDASRALLQPGTKVYVAHLPKQEWATTQEAAQAVRAAGFHPVPHIPVRLLTDAQTLDRMLGELVRNAQLEEVLLISGDYPQAVGPYSMVSEVLRSGVLSKHGLKRVSVAGHPEGHPQVALDEIRRSELDKATLGQQAGLDVALVTQVFFEHAPFLRWVEELRAHGVHSRVVAGLAGPTGLTKLIKFALRCGAGASIRALTSRPGSMMKLLGEQGPEDVVRGLAEARANNQTDFTGLHMFCFGGYLRTCEWLHAVANGQFTLNDNGGFKVSR
jgi:methylenetetrahydrofolate reductase (NADPH)